MKKLILMMSIISLIIVVSCGKETPIITNPNITTDSGDANNPTPPVDNGDNNNNDNDNNSDDNGSDSGNNEPDIPLTPVEPSIPIPQYPEDPGSEYGKIIDVVTPTIYVDNTWNNTWKVREKDYKRINYIWGQILSTFERDNSGIGIVFGSALVVPIKNHKDLSKGRPTDERLYATTWKDRNYDLKQPFHKYSQDYNTHKFQSTHTAKFWKYGVMVKISDHSGWGTTHWTGKYTIGGVYRTPHRLAYGGESRFTTADSGDDELMIIRMDRHWDYGGKRFYRIQLLFRANINNRVDEISQSKIYQYSDFDFGVDNRPEYSEYLWATKKINTTTLQR